MEITGTLNSELVRYLDLNTREIQLTASNMANIDTPGYRAVGMDFEAEMKQAMKSVDAGTALPKALVAAWKSAVRADLAVRPFSQLDFAAFPERPPVLKPDEELPVSAYLAYGATLVAVAITRRYILYSQLGDGDILSVQGDGTVLRPLPRQHEYMANQTVSLCSHLAHEKFQIRVDAMRSPTPALIMLSTDGYANCFGNDREFFRVGGDYLKYLRAEGTDFIREKLAGWLSQSSHDGSGDDITVGLAARSSMLVAGGNI